MSCHAYIIRSILENSSSKEDLNWTHFDPLCRADGKYIEDDNHLFLNDHFARKVWKLAFQRKWTSVYSSISRYTHAFNFSRIMFKMVHELWIQLMGCVRTLQYMSKWTVFQNEIYKLYIIIQLAYTYFNVSQES